jgi:transcription elongation factor Elf1
MKKKQQYPLCNKQTPLNMYYEMETSSASNKEKKLQHIHERLRNMKQETTSKYNAFMQCIDAIKEEVDDLVNGNATLQSVMCTICEMDTQIAHSSYQRDIQDHVQDLYHQFKDELFEKRITNTKTFIESCEDHLFMNNISNDMWLLILGFLDQRSTMECRLVSRGMFQTIHKGVWSVFIRPALLKVDYASSVSFPWIRYACLYLLYRETTTNTYSLILKAMHGESFNCTKLFQDDYMVLEKMANILPLNLLQEIYLELGSGYIINNNEMSTCKSVCIQGRYLFDYVTRIQGTGIVSFCSDRGYFLYYLNKKTNLFHSSECSIAHSAIGFHHCISLPGDAFQVFKEDGTITFYPLVISNNRGISLFIQKYKKHFTEYISCKWKERTCFIEIKNKLAKANNHSCVVYKMTNSDLDYDKMVKVMKHLVSKKWHVNVAIGLVQEKPNKYGDACIVFHGNDYKTINIWQYSK